MDILIGSGTGRFLSYDPTTKETKVLLKGKFCFHCWADVAPEHMGSRGEICPLSSASVAGVGVGGRGIVCSVGILGHP